MQDIFSAQEKVTDCIEALAALDKLAQERFAMLQVRVWNHHKADMFAFAKYPGVGGISPEVEVLYHARGSAFVGC